MDYRFRGKFGGGEMKRCKNLFSSVILVILSLIFFQEEASAVPIFARKYNTSCMTCHIGFPKLNAFGEAFRNNGFRLPNDEVFVKEPPVWLGSEAYKRVWPNAVWPSSIPSNVPLSFQISGEPSYQRSRTTTSGTAPKGQGRFSFSLPTEIVLNSITTLGDNFSFLLAYALFEQQGQNGLELASLGYNDFLAGKYGIPHDLLNLKIGLLQPQAMPFSVNQTLTANTPAIYGFHISSANQPAFSDAQMGVELYGDINKHTRYVLGVVNGVAAQATQNYGDNNSDKDFYGRIEHKFGGLAYDGSADSQNQDQLASGMDHFDQGPSLTLGSTAYYGTDQIAPPADDQTHYWRATAFARANSGRFNVDAVYLHEGDNKHVEQYYAIGNKGININGFYVEGTAVIYPWLFFVTRYERLVTDHIALLSSADTAANTLNTSQLTLSLPIYARANIRIIPEIVSGTNDPGKPDTYRVRIHLAY